MRPPSGNNMTNKSRGLSILFLCVAFATLANAQSNSKPSDKFRQLEELKSPKQERFNSRGFV